MVTHPSAPAAAPPSSGEPLQLENGLQLVWEEDHRQPLVALEARIRGGLRGEGPYGGTGITHFIEHMLFKGTPSRPPGTIEQEVRRYGGTINAFTSFDTTGVTLFVEARHLREALELLADILQHAVFDQQEFDKERAVIISEIQMNLDDPDRRISQLFFNRHFLEHPYRHPILGYQPLLEQLTVKDLAAFYAAQYQPQHVTIACVGDFDGRALPELARTIFGGWPRGTGSPEQLLVPQEPPPASAKTATLALPVQSAYIVLGFSSTRLSEPDLYPLDVLASVLGRGRSSRLYETLVRRHELASVVNAWNYTPYDPGVLGIQLRTDPDNTDAAIQAALEVLADIQRRGISDAELRKAKRQVSADYLFGLQTVEAKAGDLANSMSLTGDPLFSRRYVEGIARVTARQVQAAAKRYCDPAKMTTAIIRPLTAAPSVEAAADAGAGTRGAHVNRITLENGARLLVGTETSLPIAAMVVAFHGGVRVETEDTQGLSNLVANLLTKGTKRKSAFEIAQQVESLGGRLEAFSGRDGFGLVLQVLSEDLPEGLALIHELVTQSEFPEHAVANQRRLIAKELLAQEDDVFHVGGRLLRRTLFGTHPYRLHPLGDRSTIGQLTREDCAAFAKRWLVPSNMVVGVFGSLDEAEVTQQLSRTFGVMPRGVSPWPAELPEARPSRLLEAAQTLDKEQAVIMLGFLGSTHTSADRYALDVMTAILSGMAGRFFQAVRERHGLSYTLGAVHTPGWDPGYLMIYAATKPAEQAHVLRVLDEQLQLVLAEGFTEEEVDQARRYLIGLHRLELQHLAGLAKRSAIDELYGVGFDAWMRYEDRINAVTASTVDDAAKRYLTMQQRARVVISPNGHVR